MENEKHYYWKSEIRRDSSITWFYIPVVQDEDGRWVKEPGSKWTLFKE